MMNKKSKTLVAFMTGAVMAGSIFTAHPVRASEPFLGQIEYYAFNFAPRGWAKCDGQILPINQNQSLYALLGTTFGGDGRTSFALPDMRGRMPVHDGGGAGAGLTRRVLGQRGGAETVALTANELPSHNHTLRGTTAAANQVVPGGNTLAAASTVSEENYRNEAPNTTMQSGSVGSTATSSGHENRAPYLVVNCSIALQGLFPSRN